MITKRIIFLLYFTMFLFRLNVAACVDGLKDYGFKTLETPITNETFSFCKDIYSVHGTCVDQNTIEDYFLELKKEKTTGFMSMLSEINNNLDQYDTVINELLVNYKGLSDQQKVVKTEKEKMTLKFSDAKSYYSFAEKKIIEAYGDDSIFLVRINSCYIELAGAEGKDTDIKSHDLANKNIELCEKWYGEDSLHSIQAWLIGISSTQLEGDNVQMIFN